MPAPSLKNILNENTDQLRFLTCGSVDDGKSTLIGRLLHDAGLLYDDQRAALYQHDTPDFSRLLDGLQAEQEQGITIDVAYRAFATARRRFLVADAPGHEQYTPNMVTAASNAELAVLLLDARHDPQQGLPLQTRRHARIALLMGIRTLLLAVNKMDLVDYAQTRFDAIRHTFEEFALPLGAKLCCIPLSALHGDNVVHGSPAMPWYQGPTLLEYLENALPALPAELPLRLPVQWINRPHADFRGTSGTIASGTVRIGDRLCVADTGVGSQVSRILIGDQERKEAHTGDPVTLCFASPIDVSRGHLLVAEDQQPERSNQLCADIIWMGREALLPGRTYIFKNGCRECFMTVTAIKNRFFGAPSTENASHLAFNEMGQCLLSLSRELPFEPYERSRLLGGFLIIDRLRNSSVGAGLIRHGLLSVHADWRNFSVDKAARAAAKAQKPCVLWFTGLPASGKSCIADMLERRLSALGRHCYLLDSDNVRRGLSRNLGFSPEDRVENIRRVGEVAHLMVDAGLIVLASFISPYQDERRMVRELFADNEFFEIYVDTPLELCRLRDTKGLYHKANQGIVYNLTGLDAPYEIPEHPDCIVHGTDSPESITEELIRFLESRAITDQTL